MGKATTTLTALLFASTFVLTACDSGSPDAVATSVPRSPAPVTTHPAVEAVNPDPNFDWGYTVQLTNLGFHPRQLVAPCCQVVTWKNMTPHAAVIVFDHLHFKSPAIPPGGTWQYLPKGPQSISFYLDGVTGQPVLGSVLVQQTALE